MSPLAKSIRRSLTPSVQASKERSTKEGSYRDSLGPDGANNRQYAHSDFSSESGDERGFLNEEELFGAGPSSQGAAHRDSGSQDERGMTRRESMHRDETRAAQRDNFQQNAGGIATSGKSVNSNARAAANRDLADQNASRRASREPSQDAGSPIAPFQTTQSLDDSSSYSEHAESSFEQVWSFSESSYLCWHGALPLTRYAHHVCYVLHVYTDVVVF